MNKKSYYVYILTNKNNTSLYTGLSSKIDQRIWIHKTGIIKKSFSSQYQNHKLIYLEKFDSALLAIRREKEIKAWRREKKETLIEKMNPYWVEIELDAFF